MKKQTVRLAGEMVLLLVAAGALLFLGLWWSGGAPAAEAPVQQEDSLALAAGMRKVPAAPLEPLGEELTVAERLDAASLAAQVKLALAEDPVLRPFTFDPSARGGRITLWGDVQTRAQYRRAAEVAQAVEGVASVRNEVTVQGEPFVTATADAGEEGAEQQAPRGAEFHVVEPGESLWMIARENGTTVGRIKRLNDMGSIRLQPGDRLRVR